MYASAVFISGTPPTVGIFVLSISVAQTFVALAPVAPIEPVRVKEPVPSATDVNVHLPFPSMQDVCEPAPFSPSMIQSVSAALPRLIDKAQRVASITISGVVELSYVCCRFDVPSVEPTLPPMKGRISTILFIFTALFCTIISATATSHDVAWSMKTP